MDPTQQPQQQHHRQQSQHQHIPEDHNPNLTGPPYNFYPTEQDPTTYGMAYNPQIPPYQVVQHPGPPPRQLSQPDLAQQQQAAGLQFHNLSLMSAHQYPAPVYASPPQQHVSNPLSASPPPQSPNMYDPLSPPISGSDTSADGVYHHQHHHQHPHPHPHPHHHHSRNSSTGSPTSSRHSSLVHRHPIRYNPTPSPTSSSGHRRGRSLHDSDDEDMGADFTSNLAHTRKEATRRQRIEAEQRRRDELRDGYAKLKDVLPISNQKSSKVSLLERATNYIITVERANQDMRARLELLEGEVNRLQKLNEKISLGVASTPSPGHPGSLPLDSRPLSPPPENGLSHALGPIRGHEPPRGGSRSPSSDRGY